MDEASLFDFARRCASSYCARYGSDQFDDATQEACAFLLNNREKWFLPDGALAWRTKRALVRWYQNEHNGRKKVKPPKRADVDLDSIAEESFEYDPIAAEEQRQRLELIRRALRDSMLTGSEELVYDLITGLETRPEIAAKYKTTVKRVNQIYKTFKQTIERIADVRGVEIVDSATEEEIEQCPLFSTIQNNDAS